MVLEQPSRSSKALVGDTFLCLIGDQFARLKLGDRYFYDLGGQSGSFTQGNYLQSYEISTIIANVINMII